MTPVELIAALEAAPTGTRELGVAVLQAIGAKAYGAGWLLGGNFVIQYSMGEDESRVVTDLNFRLPGVPHMWWQIWSTASGWTAEAGLMVGDGRFMGVAHTERLARCVAELKAVLAARHLTISTQEAQEAP